MALRIEDIKDVDVAKQVALLAVAENDRLHKRLEAMVKEMAALKGESGAKQLELELLHLKEQMAALQHRMFAASSEKRPRDKDAKDKAPAVRSSRASSASSSSRSRSTNSPAASGHAQAVVTRCSSGAVRRT